MSNQGKNILVVGATGTTGSEVVKQALELGYKVSAFVRNPAKVTLKHDNLTVIQGDVMNPNSIDNAVRGHEAVISSLGAGAKGTIRSEGTNNVIRAMEKADIRRFISQSTLGVGESRGNLNFYWKYIMFGLLIRKAFMDHIKQEKVIQQSRLDWTIVRPGALTAGDKTGKYRHGFSGQDRSISLKISAADTADFMLKQLSSDVYLHKTPSLSY
ncbi:MAG: SDR family oxidoreductase [Deinococcota bacterium]